MAVLTDGGPAVLEDVLKISPALIIFVAMNKKTNILHLLFTLVITITSVTVLAVVLLILNAIFSDPLRSTPAKVWINMLLIFCAVFAMALLVLAQLRKKVLTADPSKAFSYRIAIIVTALIFICAVYTPVVALITGSSGNGLTPQQEKDAQKEEQLIEQFMKETTFGDSLSEEQTKRIADSLENNLTADTVPTK